MTVTVLVCGGGNGAHVMAALAGCRPGVKVRVLSLYEDEAERWSKILETNDLKVTGRDPDGTLKTKVGHPEFVTKDAAKAVHGAQMICFVVPAFAHEIYFKTIAPHLEDGTVIVGIPSAAGFEFQARALLGEKDKTCSFMAYESLPWSCRILEFGKHVRILGFKERLAGGMRIGTHEPLVHPMDILDALQLVIGPNPKLNTAGHHLLGVTLMGTNSYIHPCIMYGQWHEYDGKPIKEEPPFYQGMDDFAADLLTAVSDEIIHLAKVIMEKDPKADLSIVRPIYQWYQDCYGIQIKDKTNLRTSCHSNPGYDGLVHPCTELKDGTFVPDYDYRYLAEDIPFGLAVIKGVADLAGVATPKLDMVLHWSQSKLDKEYIVGKSLTGKDVKESRAPETYGLNTLEAALDV